MSHINFIICLIAIITVDLKKGVHIYMDSFFYLHSIIICDILYVSRIEIYNNFHFCFVWEKLYIGIASFLCVVILLVICYNLYIFRERILML